MEAHLEIELKIPEKHQFTEKRSSLHRNLIGNETESALKIPYYDSDRLARSLLKVN